MLKLTFRVMVIGIIILSIINVSALMFSDTLTVYYADYNDELYVWDAVTNEIENITPIIPDTTNLQNRFYSYSISPSQTHILTYGNETRTTPDGLIYPHVVYLSDINGTNTIELLRPDVEVLLIDNVSWSPDEQYIAVTIRSFVGFGVWIFTREGALLTEHVVSTSDDDYNPETTYIPVESNLVWSADSEMLYIIGYTEQQITTLSLEALTNAQIEENYHLTVDYDVFTMVTRPSPTQPEIILFQYLPNILIYFNVETGDITILSEGVNILTLDWSLDGEVFGWITLSNERHLTIHTVQADRIDTITEANYPVSENLAYNIYKLWFTDEHSTVFFGISGNICTVDIENGLSCLELSERPFEVIQVIP